MESKIRTLILFIFLLSFKTILAQDWVNYLGDTDIQAIAEEGDFLYVGFQHGGLRKINKTTGEITLYHKHNSGLTSNNITSIVIDTNGDKWIGTDEGILGTGGSLFKFNDVNWEEYNYNNSGIRNVYSITIDNSGNKLIGTQSGLFIFNGTNWTKHLPYPDGNSLDNVIHDVEVNTNGEIWVNASQKLAKFDGVSWTDYGLSNDLRTLLSYKDNMWFGTDRGLFKFDGTNWSVFDTSNSDISNNKVYSLFKDKNDILWIGGGGLSKFDGQNWTVFNVLNSNINSSTIEIVIIDRDGIKWMKTEKGLVKFDEVTSNIIPTANTIPSNNVKAIAIENNIKWIGTDKGLTKFDGTSWVTFNTENSQLPSNEVTSIRIDQVGNKWIGTNNGIVKFDGVNWTIFNESNSILSSNSIKYIEVDNKNHIWIVVGNKGIFEFDGVDWIYLINAETQGSYINQIDFDSNDNLWIVDGYYLDMYDGTSWTNYNSSNSNLTQAAYSSLAIDKNDVKWIGAVQDGFDYSNITKLEGVSNFTTYSHDVTNTFRTRKILIDNNDNKWIGDIELIKYDNINWTVIDSKLPLESMPSNGITDLAIDSDNKLWIATLFGLAVYTLPDNNVDVDGDGIINNLDLCPNTAAGETVDANGCSDSQLTADDDNDGISNLNDDCPNTPTNDIVNTSGCSIINIPDVNFEQALIDLGFDSDGIINQQILSSDATVVTNLNLYGKNINDLTGIEGFNNLTTLLCGNNNLTYLNISQNTKLVDLQCNTNSLTSLDVSNNIALTKLFCAYNQITNLNVTNNILLEQLDCSVNQITSLDITNNSLLTVFSCHTNNPLNSLNIKNGNNTSIITFYANLNPNLTCITVDNVDWSTLNWTAIDSQTSYSENCGNNDTDGDGVYDTNDLCPATPDGEAVDTNGCSQSQLDDDNDGVVNSLDQCPNTPSGETVDVNGCSQSQIDDDGDGIMNDVDTCADTPTGEAVDTNGCSQSQLDDDNDGVVNSLDTCPDTPSGETVNVNGCSQSQIDDDGDGVVNSLDTCPNTPSGETVDVNGCSQSQIDDDGDGIMNDVDTCADTPTGEEVNATGCSQSQLDDDNDGVMNNLDQCPNTPTGETVDANGCILLASDNFTIEIISETCPNKNNGRIIISAQLSYNYIATINGADYDFTTNLTVDNLSPGNYEICIIVTNQTSPYCYNIVILEGTTISGKASVTTNKAAIEITQGTPPYIVLINGKEQLQTVSPLFTIDVKHGDLLEVKTGVACEGIFSKTIDLFEVITAYPNPTSGIFEIALPMSLKEIKIELFTTNNQLISSKTYSVINGKVQLNIENMPVAVYFAKVHLNKPVTLKIIKQ